MKITVAPDGSISLDVPTDQTSVATAAALVRALQRNGRADPSQAQIAPKPQPNPEPRKRGVSKLTPALAETRKLLADTSNAVTPTQVAAELGISRPTATWRLRELVGKGFAYRPKRGLYKLVPKRG